MYSSAACSFLLSQTDFHMTFSHRTFRNLSAVLANAKGFTEGPEIGCELSISFLHTNPFYPSGPC